MQQDILSVSTFGEERKMLVVSSIVLGDDTLSFPENRKEVQEWREALQALLTADVHMLIVEMDKISSIQYGITEVLWDIRWAAKRVGIAFVLAALHPAIQDRYAFLEKRGIFTVMETSAGELALQMQKGI